MHKTPMNTRNILWGEMSELEMLRQSLMGGGFKILPDFVATMRSLRVEMKSYRVDNEKLVKAREELNQLNAAMLQSLTDIQRQMNSRDQTVRPEGSKSTPRRRNRYPSGSSDSKGSTGGSSSSHKNKKKRRYQNRSRDEFKKKRPPTFNGEVKNS